MSTEFLSENSEYGNSGGESITINELGKFNYLFAVNKIQDLSNGRIYGEYNESSGRYDYDKIIVQKDDNPITKSKAKVKVFSNKYINSLIEITIPSSISKETVIGEYSKEKNYNWWVVFCIDGKNGIDSLKVINKLMSTEPTFEFCEDYDKGKLHGNESFIKNVKSNKLKSRS